MLAGLAASRLEELVCFFNRLPQSAMVACEFLMDDASGCD
jgi:hypothetical protein